mmetsp:Transcript_25109/g.63665  ORF Transcript_25109/g.63665 Transcript_25109/m.63665 type:complete len:251 (-) Transcript_25109:1117-1869(-)
MPGHPRQRLGMCLALLAACWGAPQSPQPGSLAGPLGAVAAAQCLLHLLPRRPDAHCGWHCQPWLAAPAGRVTRPCGSAARSAPRPCCPRALGSAAGGWCSAATAQGARQRSVPAACPAPAAACAPTRRVRAGAGSQRQRLRPRPAPRPSCPTAPTAPTPGARGWVRLGPAAARWRLGRAPLRLGRPGVEGSVATPQQASEGCQGCSHRCRAKAPLQLQPWPWPQPLCVRPQPNSRCWHCPRRPRRATRAG